MDTRSPPPAPPQPEDDDDDEPLSLSLGFKMSGREARVWRRAAPPIWLDQIVLHDSRPL